MTSRPLSTFSDLLWLVFRWDVVRTVAGSPVSSQPGVFYWCIVPLLVVGHGTCNRQHTGPNLKCACAEKDVISRLGKIANEEESTCGCPSARMRGMSVYMRSSVGAFLNACFLRTREISRDCDRNKSGQQKNDQEKEKQTSTTERKEKK